MTTSSSARKTGPRWLPLLALGVLLAMTLWRILDPELDTGALFLTLSGLTALCLIALCRRPHRHNSVSGLVIGASVYSVLPWPDGSMDTAPAAGTLIVALIWGVLQLTEPLRGAGASRDPEEGDPQP